MTHTAKSPTQAPSSPVRLVDVAAAAGVSRATASKVLLGTGGPNTRVSEKTAQRIQAIADKLEFRPNLAAQQLKGMRTRMIGLITGSGSSPVLYDRLMKFETETWMHGYRLLPGHAHGSMERAVAYLDDLVARGAEGLLIVHFTGEMLDTITRKLDKRYNIPIVYQCQEPAPNAHYVLLDRKDGVRQAVRHLHDRGRRRIALMSGAGNASVVGLRRQGYRAGLEECGLPHDLELEWNRLATNPQYTDFDQAVNDLIVAQQADAVVASNDFIGVNMSKALRKQGMGVPDDVAIVGFDNLDIAAAAEPELTTVDQCNDDVAKQTVSLLLELIDSKQAATAAYQQLVVKPKLVVRASS